MKSISSLGINLDTLYEALEELYAGGFFSSPALFKSRTFVSKKDGKTLQNFNDAYAKAKIPDLKKIGLIDHYENITDIGFLYVTSTNTNLRMLIKRLQTLYFFSFQTNTYPYFYFVKELYKKSSDYMTKIEVENFLHKRGFKISSNAYKYFTFHLQHIGLVMRDKDRVYKNFSLSPHVMSRLLIFNPPIPTNEVEYYHYYHSSDILKKALYFRFNLISRF